ncbi:aminomethyl-transferring glycine dehydrogenase subunit GcvPA [Thermoanaerobacterium thermosaccharolyticum]|uniref:aminomethyl-transferring glycine dehydrogenase subunit GcvPA n=1 Tax=Thermoanaerobacterium thermosaccharolyticum TaxID=1517 RepID=UPI0020A245CF|nr:aminomethyl-transferring glycine dehydrogenase subunit GcvPA [Thermoanaerobacterium thermosaccharolyticum]MCP2239065.1 glycine dehydrogenase subunit 1 [Thermoanaerobacterium thermosaccharolyticum]
MHQYIPSSNDEQMEMLKSVNAKSIEDLFVDIPESIRLNKNLNLKGPLSEPELLNHMNEISKEIKTTDELTCFLGAGVYDHFIPSVVKHVVSKPEFYTAYTPYQPEISQGTLQAIFEYQTMICNLTGMDVSNASMYDGATALSEAAKMASNATNRKKVLISSSLNPEVKKVLHTYMRFSNIELVEIDDLDGTVDLEILKSSLDRDAAAFIVQNPNFFGIIEDLEDIEKMVHENGSLLIMYVEPISLSILKTPGEIGADIAVGDGQPLGNSLNFGGPHLGFMATTKKLIRKLPGRIIGETNDVDGKRGYVLTLQAREQHIRREKATSNICTNHSLNALTAAVYMATLGKHGIKEVALQCFKKSHYAYNQLIKTNKYKMLFDKPFFMEFAIVCSDKNVYAINNVLLSNGIIGGYNLEKEYKKYKNAMLLCVTEKRTKDEIDKLVNIMGGVVNEL